MGLFRATGVGLPKRSDLSDNTLMKIAFDYNWPPGNRFVRVSFGLANMEDKTSLFRVGVVRKEDPSKVYYWRRESEWLTHEELQKVTFDAQRGDKVTVSKKGTEKEQIRHRYFWDTEKEWPAEADGGSMTEVPYWL
jgi:hypothetical protein